MRIKQKQGPQYNYSSLDAGDTFLWEGNYYIKTSHNESWESGMVELSSGFYYDVFDDFIVESVDIEGELV